MKEKTCQIQQYQQPTVTQENTQAAHEWSLREFLALCIYCNGAFYLTFYQALLMK